MTAREMALQILYKVNEEQAFANIALENAMSGKKLDDKRDAGLVTEIVNGTIKNKIYLDYVIAQFSRQKIEKLSPWVRNILRMSVYQLLFLDKIPESAAVNEGVNLTKKYSHQGSVRFANAVLRNVIRKKGQWEIPSKEEKPVQFLSITYSFPEWLVAFFIDEYGIENTEALLSYFNQVPPLWVRRNALKISKELFEQKLLEAGLSYKRSPFVSEGYQITERSNLFATEMYASGLLSLQDETSMFAVDILDPQPGETILDACSAPGGKTMFIAERMQNTGMLKAMDLYSQRMAIVSREANRMGVSIMETDVCDAGKADQKYDQIFDRILIDAPCSGLGVLGRRSDLRYHAESCKFSEMIQVQQAILKSAANILKPEGVLVYSTCTLHAAENADMIENFLSTHPDFERMDISKYEAYLDNNGNLQTLPFRDNKSGFFVAKLRKRGSD